LKSFEEIPKALIRARISLGLSQKDLAERMGLKEQQIQRYEADEYRAASLARVREFISQLNIKISKQAEPWQEGMTYENLFQRLGSAGIDPNFAITKILPPELAKELEAKGKDTQMDKTAIEVAQRIGSVYGWTPDQILGPESLQIDMSRLGNVQFKLRRNANRSRVVAQAFYSHYLALLVLQACSELPVRPLPRNPYEIYKSITKVGQPISLDNALRHVWSLGMPILALVDSGGTQGTHFKEGLRSVLVLNDSTAYQARFMFVLFHEFWHAAVHQNDDRQRSFVLEEFQDLPSGNKETDNEEHIANEFAGAVLLGRNPNKLVKMCYDESQGDLLKMKQAVQLVAAREMVPVDVLANIVAFRLAEEGANWWGAANNLQTTNPEMPRVAGRILAEFIDPTRIAPSDLDLLRRAIRLLEVREA
jgi:transcriptional regulator with XRE-family HTH domain/Zn-dependent peptidase ImmA (M78 family)